MLFGSAFGGQQVDGIISFQDDIISCRDLAPLHGKVALASPCGGEIDIVACRHGTALCGAAGLGAGATYADADLIGVCNSFFRDKSLLAIFIVISLGLHALNPSS